MENYVPSTPGNFRKFTPEFLVKWKAPIVPCRKPINYVNSIMLFTSPTSLRTTALVPGWIDK